jgi:hypothetical protein
MKRFLVFAYEIYYPQGGMEDFKGDCDTLLEAHELLKQRESHEERFHIYDTVTRKIVFSHDIADDNEDNYYEQSHYEEDEN